MSHVPFRNIELNENEVPGSRLPNIQIDSNSVIQLRRFLDVRAVKYPKSCRKDDLVELVERTLSNNVPIDSTADGGKWLQKKSQEVRAADINRAASENPKIHDVFPIVGWHPFASRLIPHFFCYGTLYKYIMECRSLLPDPEPTMENTDDDEESGDLLFATTKPLRRGRYYFTSGHVQHLEDSVSVQGHFCLRGKVRSSFKENIYMVMVKIDYASGDVIDGFCHCKASAMARCSHVAALLLTLEDYTIQFGYNPQACTSRVCEWNKGRKQKTSLPIYEGKYTDKRDPTRVVKFTTYKPESHLKEADRLKYACELLSQSSMWCTVLQYSYSDYELIPEDLETMQELRLQLQTALQFNFTSSRCVEGTELQSQSELWKQLRTILITASTCTNYLSTATARKKLSTLMYDRKIIDNVYVRFGRDHEDLARVSYESKTGFSVQTTGLWVNPQFPGLGVSPDGIVTTSTGEKGLLEIKCSYLLRNHLPTNLDKLTAPQRNAFFLKRNPSGDVHLSRSHKYFKQVQMQLAIVDLQWCDFVVFTLKDIFIERIFRNDAWWVPASAALLQFHAEYVCPEYFVSNIPRRLEPIRLEWRDGKPAIANPEEQQLQYPEGADELSTLAMEGCLEIDVPFEDSQPNTHTDQEPMQTDDAERIDQAASTKTPTKKTARQILDSSSEDEEE